MIRAALAVLLTWIAGAAAAQVPATLVADSIVVTSDDRLIAEGSVEVLYDGTRLSARRVVYDRGADVLTIEGPILVVTPDGDVFEATQASLNPQLEGGILLGARLVLDRQLQLAAGRIARVDGRYSSLDEVAATSCRVCAGRTALWEIRARRVVHDEEERQLYFEDAQFRIKGVPVFYLPRMRLPDPSLDRARGLLIPSIRSSDLLGTGLRLPYFIPLGDARDLTITPYVTPETRTLELRYRQVSDAGALQIAGAITRDTLEPDETRGYAAVAGAYALPRNYRLTFDIETVSDRAYLLDYGLTDTDLLQSEVAVLRVRDDEYIRGGFIVLESLRDGEVGDELPSLIGELQYERRMDPPGLGGTLTLEAGFDSVFRASEADVLGRDVGRAGLALDWRRSWVGPAGLVAEAEALVGADHYTVSEDSGFDRGATRTRAATGVSLRWPLIGTTTREAVHVIEPVAQVAWSDTWGDAVPNEDSTTDEFDEGNLLSLSRFAGDDLVETGFRGAAGLTWTREGAAGWRSTLTFGRVFRESPAPDFSDSSGLSGQQSQWLIAGHLVFGSNLQFGVRSLLDDTADFTKTEARLDWTGDRVDLAAAYAFQPSDTGEGRADAVSEWTLDGSWQITDIWAISGQARYDLVADSPARASVGVDWRNECVAVGLSVSRRYTSSDNVEPVTDYGLAVELLGFSANGANAVPARGCSG